MFHGKTVDFINVRLVFQQEKEEFVFDHVWSFLQVWFFVNEIFVVQQKSEKNQLYLQILNHVS